MTDVGAVGTKQSGLDVEDGLRHLIDSRYSPEEDERAAQVRAESVRNFNLRAKAERRKEWAAYHSGLARLHRRLANEHDEAVRRLIDGAAP